MARLTLVGRQKTCGCLWACGVQKLQESKPTLLFEAVTCGLRPSLPPRGTSTLEGGVKYELKSRGKSPTAQAKWPGDSLVMLRTWCIGRKLGFT